MNNNHKLDLAFNLSYKDLYDLSGLYKIDSIFLDFLKFQDQILYNNYKVAKKNYKNLSASFLSDLLVNSAPHLENFIGKLFKIEEELKYIFEKDNKFGLLYQCKRSFIQRLIFQKYKDVKISNSAPPYHFKKMSQYMEKEFYGDEIEFSIYILEWMRSPETYKDQLIVAEEYAAWALFTEQGKKQHKDGTLFKIPAKVDFNNLVSLDNDCSDRDFVQRNGFVLNDSGISQQFVSDQANYCLWCHERNKDSCSKGLRDNKNYNIFSKNPLGSNLFGCPLEEKISEMNKVKASGYNIGALAIITIDNPLVAATGHRICNDCMKSCIFQKQEPVNIPAIETQILKEVLELPWGFEIYSLLTRWNPLRLTSSLPKKPTNYKILVVGMGPAGFTLAHYLTQDGHTVVAIDGCKIEPLPKNLVGEKIYKKQSFLPIKNIIEIYENLDERIINGFGGVAEYGITVRWDKNFLKIIRIILERNALFSLFDGVRLGSTMSINNAFDLGFDHIALCTGSGKPNILNIENGLASGVRQASDFLMTLQLTGAAKKESLANLTVRLPIVVIGGGLTAVDAATEALAYYPRQLEKFLERYNKLIEIYGKESVERNWLKEDREIFEEFLNHAHFIQKEIEDARKENRTAKIYDLLKKWGGASIVYRNGLEIAPSYRLNHEELSKALEEGIKFIPNLSPKQILVDEFGYAKAIKFKEGVTLNAKTILIATGTQPNTTLADDEQGIFDMDGVYFKAIDEKGNAIALDNNNPKSEFSQVLTFKDKANRYISFFGDLHPSYRGNVVRAMASAKKGYPVIRKVLSLRSPSSLNTKKFFKFIEPLLVATIYKINRLTSNIVELIIKAPLASNNFRPGQFYRLQNYETYSTFINGTRLSMESIAVTGAHNDKEKGLVSVIILEMGASSRLCAYLKIGEKIVLMGPTGAPTCIPKDENIMLIGGGLGNAVLFSIGKALRENNCKVLYFAAYKSLKDRFKVSEIELASDVTVWCCEESPGYKISRPNDLTFVGNVIAAVEAYGKNFFGSQFIPMKEIDRIIVIGSDRMMAALAKARERNINDYLKQNHVVIGSINSPMQCMMKGVCAQCLQRQINPKTKEETIVFSCINQDQKLDWVDFESLKDRLSQNSFQEKLTNTWVTHCLSQAFSQSSINNKDETLKLQI